MVDGERLDGQMELCIESASCRVHVNVRRTTSISVGKVSGCIRFGTVAILISG